MPLLLSKLSTAITCTVHSVPPEKMNKVSFCEQLTFYNIIPSALACAIPLFIPSLFVLYYQVQVSFEHHIPLGSGMVTASFHLLAFLAYIQLQLCTIQCIRPILCMLLKIQHSNLHTYRV